MFGTFLQFVHILSLVCWLGSIIFFSFFAAPAIFGTLDREKAGEVVGRIFPKYYMIGYVCGVLILVTLLLGTQMVSVPKLGLLLVMLGCTLVAGLGINPRAREMKAGMKAAQTPEDREPLEAKFKSLHSLSVKLNGTVLLAGLGFLWITAEGLGL